MYRLMFSVDTCFQAKNSKRDSKPWTIITKHLKWLLLKVHLVNRSVGNDYCV